MTGPVEDYGREAPVALRGQRLRRTAAEQSGDGIKPDGQRPDEDSAETDSAGADDPYGVGAEALEAAESSPSPEAPARGGLFAEDTGPADPSPARWGWRGRVNAAVGTRLAAEPAEMAHRENLAAIGQAPPGMITVANPKGGSGKTPVSLLLAAAVGECRPGVVVWDACEAGGTLADRAERRSAAGIADLLARAPQLAASGASAADLAGLLTAQREGHAVLGTALDGSQRHIGVGAAECQAIMAVLRRHRDFLVVDTGNNSFAPAWQWSVTHADELVIPVPLRPDAARAAYAMCEQLVADGRADLVAAARVLLIADPAGAGVPEATVQDELGRLGITRVSRLPFDPALSAGGRIARMTAVAESTRRAFTDLAARIAGDVAAASGPSSLAGREPADTHTAPGAGQWPRAVTDTKEVGQ